MEPEGERQEHLRFCDGVLIYYGEASGQRVEMKLMDLLKAPGYGRACPLTARAVYVGPPDNCRKQRFRTQSAQVLAGGAVPDGDVLKEFLSQVDQATEEEA